MTESSENNRKWTRNDLRRRQTKTKWWICFVRSNSIQITRRFVAEINFETRKLRSEIDFTFMKTQLSIGSISNKYWRYFIWSNLPHCSHRGSFLPIWSFWLFWNWCWWWTFFVFLHIFESDHQTVSIGTIEILKNHLKFVKIVLHVMYYFV